MTWYYQNSEFKDVPEGIIGFVYLITNENNGRLYVGKKLFSFSKKTRATKKNPRRKTVKTESDWKTYFGSNDELKKDMETQDVSKIRREILHLCKTKGECSYLEAKEQFLRDVLVKEEYYNGYIMCRINKSHIKGLINE